MKTFEVELRRTSFITYTVKANTQEEAEAKAWEELENDPDWAGGDADWDVESIEEVNPRT